MTIDIEQALAELDRDDVIGLFNFAVTMDRLGCRPLAAWLQAAVIDHHSDVQPPRLVVVQWSDETMRAALTDCSHLLGICRSNRLQGAERLFNAVTDHLLTELHDRRDHA